MPSWLSNGPSFLKQYALTGIIVTGIIGNLLLGGFFARPIVPLISGDAPDYISMAHTLRYQGLSSIIKRNDQGHALIGSVREPGYGIILGLIMALDPAARQFDPSCISENRAESCDEQALLTPLWVNRGFVALSGLILFFAAQRLIGGLLAPSLAGGHIWLNLAVHKNTVGIISDSLALLLVAMLTFTVIWAYQKRSIGYWLIPGLVLAALALTKAVFHIFALILGIIILIYALLWRNRFVLMALMLASLAYIPPTFGWMARNAALGGDFAITSHDIRPGIMLLYRNLFNEVTIQQYLCAFIYWTPGIGDDLAKAWFDKETWEAFRMDHRFGFYKRSHQGYKNAVAANFRHVEEQADINVIDKRSVISDIQKQYNQELTTGLLLRPFKQVATTLPLFYRGMWGDLFAPISVPCLIIITFITLQRKHWVLFLALIPGWWSLLFYAFASLNIRRYQMTAIPALSLATATLLAPWITSIYMRLRYSSS